MHECPRCHGLLVREDVHPAYIGAIEEPLTLIRCINCGDRTDPLIVFHRLLTGTAPKEHEPMRIAS
jgi:hypothetical protein